MILNIGCGSKKYTDCINIDVRREVRPEVQADLRFLPFRDGVIERIIAEDVIEHFTREEAKLLLKECFRTLKLGGFLNIKTPFFDKIVKYYQERIFSEDEIVRRIFGGQDYESNFHMYIYNPSTMQILLEECGFKYSAYIGEEKGRSNFMMEAQKQ